MVYGAILQYYNFTKYVLYRKGLFLLGDKKVCFSLSGNPKHI